MKKTNFPDSPTQAANGRAVRTDEKVASIGRLIYDILCEIVLHPDELKVSADLISGDLVNVKIEARPSDVKRIIGSRGAHLRAVRVFCKYFGERHGVGINVPNFEVPIDNSDRYPEFTPAEDWGRERLLGILRAMAANVFTFPVDIEAVDRPDQTYVAIRIDAMEPDRVRFGMAEAFQVLGLAMSKKNGHTMSVHVLAKRGKEIAEPAGRR